MKQTQVCSQIAAEQHKLEEELFEGLILFNNAIEDSFSSKILLFFSLSKIRISSRNPCSSIAQIRYSNQMSHQAKFMSAIFKMLASTFVRLPRQLASDLLASQELASVARVRFARVTDLA